MTSLTPRPGEIQLEFDPADAPGDAKLVFIGRVRSPWTEDGPAPKNPNRARETGKSASLEVDAPYRRGLKGLKGTSHVIVLGWFHRAQRNVIVLKPGHVAEPRGAFSLRSPVRPNPIGLSVAKVLEIDEEQGIIHIDAIDFLDGTPLVDIKPYRPGIDAVPDAVVA